MLVVLATTSVNAQPAAAPGTPPVIAPIQSSPTFYERYYDEYAVPENLELLPKGKVSMYPFGVVDISAFRWTARGTDTWLLSMEEMLYLLPFIASNRPEDRDFAVRWVESWAKAHEGKASPNRMSWDGMTAARRSLVLTYLLKREEQRPDGGISEQLRGLLERHRTAITRDVEMQSNHAVWKAIALVELSRVFADSTALDDGVTRLTRLATTQVSPLGAHMEHAPLYHFVVLNWFDETEHYMEGIPGFQAPIVDTLRAVCDRMTKAGYFLQDHYESILPIGDSRRRPVFEKGHVARAPDERVFFDPDAGYACYKEPVSGRQVVFNIQGSQRRFPFHFHDDAAALVYYYSGEAILGDAGSFDYGASAYRSYVMSAMAHNLTGPATQVFAPTVDRAFRSYVVNSSLERDGGDTVFRATRRFRSTILRRSVTIPGDQPSLVVDDSLSMCDRGVALWHLGPDVVTVTADSADASWTLRTRAGRSFRLSVVVSGVEAPLDTRIVSGSRRPLLGWYSPGWQSLVKSRVIVIRFPGPARLRTEVSLIADVERTASSDDR